MEVEVWKDYVIPIAGIVVSGGLGAAAWRVAHLANQMSKRQGDLLEQQQRQIYADAVLAHYQGRREDIWYGKNGNMPHYTAAVDAASELVDAPGKRELIDWLTTSIRHVIENGPENDRQINALWFGDTVPVVVARWVRDPAAFEEPRFVLYHERSDA